MENLILPFEYLNFQIGYTLSELEPAFFTQATDSIELMQNEDFGWKIDIHYLNRKFNCILRYLEDYSDQSKNNSRKQETAKAVAACRRCQSKVANFFLGGPESSQESLGNSPTEPSQSDIATTPPLSPDSVDVVDQFPPIFSHHEAVQIYDHISEIAHETGDTQAFGQLYSAITQQYLGDLKRSVCQCLLLNDGQIDPFYSLGKTLGEIVWTPNFLSDLDRIAHFSTKLIPIFTNALYNCSKIRPSVNKFPPAFIYKDSKSICGDAFTLCKTLSKLLKKIKDDLLPSLRHKYKYKPTTFDDYKNVTKAGIEIYGKVLYELRPLHQTMLLMLILADHPVSAEDFSILNENWRDGDGGLSQKASDNISSEITKLLNDLSKILNIKNKAQLMIRSTGSDNLKRYSLNWGPIDARFDPTFAYLSNFLS